MLRLGSWAGVIRVMPSPIWLNPQRPARAARRLGRVQDGVLRLGGTCGRADRPEQPGSEAAALELGPDDHVEDPATSDCSGATRSGRRRYCRFSRTPLRATPLVARPASVVLDEFDLDDRVVRPTVSIFAVIHHGDQPRSKPASCRGAGWTSRESQAPMITGAPVDALESSRERGRGDLSRKQQSSPGRPRAPAQAAVEPRFAAQGLGAGQEPCRLCLFTIMVRDQATPAPGKSPVLIASRKLLDGRPLPRTDRASERSELGPPADRQHHNITFACSRSPACRTRSCSRSSPRRSRTSSTRCTRRRTRSAGC